MALTAVQLAGMIDHTFLKAFGGRGDVEKLCREARQYGFATVMVNPAEIENCLRLLEGCPVKVGTVAGFPLGQNTPAVKEFEIKDCLSRGAREIDMVINIRALQIGDQVIVTEEMAVLADLCRRAGAVSKTILEMCYLNEEEKRTACRLGKEAGVDFVKTSTGFGAGGATVADVRLMRQTVGGDTGIKAAGGISSLQDALAMIEAGANRLGTSNGVAIIEQMLTGASGTEARPAGY